MMPTHGLLKRSHVRMDEHPVAVGGPPAPRAPARSPAPPEPNAPALAEARIVEQTPDGAVVEVRCPCGQTLRLLCLFDPK